MRAAPPAPAESPVRALSISASSLPYSKERQAGERLERKAAFSPLSPRPGRSEAEAQIELEDLELAVAERQIQRPRVQEPRRHAHPRDPKVRRDAADVVVIHTRGRRVLDGLRRVPEAGLGERARD